MSPMSYQTAPPRDQIYKYTTINLVNIIVQSPVLQEVFHIYQQNNFSAIKFRNIMPKFIKSPNLF